MKFSKRMAAPMAAAVALLAPAAAFGHVTVQPDTAPAGGFTRFDVRVPNEEDNAATDKVEVQMPDGFVEASYEAVAGWKVDVAKQKLANPIETDDGPVSEEVKTITWTATDPAAAIQPGQFRDFGISVGLPENDQAGDVLTFPAIQTYDDGTVVRWIGQPDSETPAPQVTLTAGTEESAAAGHSNESSDAASDEAGDDDSGAPTWLVVVALVLGAAGTLMGGAALRGRHSA